MRPSPLIALALLVTAAGLGADRPIPQDAARMEKRRRDFLEWSRRTVVAPYDKVGKKDPRWDKPAREALELAARMFSHQADPPVVHEDVYKPAKAAVDAGCDDPLVLYLYHRNSVGPDYPGPEEAARRMKAAAKSLAASRYPAFRRVNALNLAGTFAVSAEAPDETAREEARRDFDAALALLPESVAGDERNEFWEFLWLDNLVEQIQGYRKLGLDAEAAYARVDAPLARLPEVKVMRLKLRSHFWRHYGWEARTNAFASAVPAGGFETLEKRLRIARDAAEEAWRLRPDDAFTATEMIDIDKSIGGDRATMELWFERAMKADGDKFEACNTKLDWLDPKWHGTAEEMVAFGRACRDTKNWRAGITLLCGDAYYRRSTRMAPEDVAKYLGSPGVWSDITTVYDEYLKHYPLDSVSRSKYAALCYRSAHYVEAHAQFQVLGDELTSWSSFPYVPLPALERMRDEAERVVTGKPPQKRDPAAR